MTDLLSELILARAPLTAPALAERLRCPLADVLHALRDSWWEIVPTASPEGWTYAPRTVLSTTARKPAERRDEWGDVISRSRYTT